ncbi:MAG: chain length determinant protein EpsF [Pseudomonadota bacterium]|nr:chain length determinant protein EpsF [Pseudomonadota bacterium]
MSFYQFLIILNARKKIALFALFVTVLTTLLVSLWLPKTYEASTSLVVNYTGSDPVTGNRLPAQLMSGYMATQVDVINSQKVALKVVDKLGLYTNPAFVEAFYEATEGQGDIRNWLAGVLLNGLTVTPSRESSVIVLGYESSDQKFAATLANTFAEAYIEANLELKIEPSKRTATWFKTQVSEMRQSLIIAKNKLSDYQREKGIVSIDERLDVENSRFSQLSQQLVMAESELFNLESKRDAIKTGDVQGSSMELVSDPIVRDLKVSLSRAEIKRDELEQRVSSKHPDYLSAQAEVASLRNKLNREIKLAISRIESNVLVAQQRVTEIKSSLVLQKEALLHINDNRNMLDILTRDVEDAKQVLSLATQRLSQTSLEGASSESDISVLNPAIEPVQSSKPNILINMILSIFLGSVLAVGLALLSELLNRKVRTVEDITAGVDLPVLGEVQFVKTPNK